MFPVNYPNVLMEALKRPLFLLLKFSDINEHMHIM